MNCGTQLRPVRPSRDFQPNSKEAVEAFRERVLTDPVYRAVFDQIEFIEAAGARLSGARLSEPSNNPACAIKIPGVNLILEFRGKP
jgi:hypothetical protein